MVTIITKTIDAAGGGDYTSFTLAEADVANIGTSSDLVANDEAIVFNVVAGTYTGLLTVESATLVSDATRYVTYQAADAGNRPLVSNEIRIRGGSDYTRFDGIDVDNAVGICFRMLTNPVVGVWVENCELTSPAAACYYSGGVTHVGSAAAPMVVNNVVFRALSPVEANYGSGDVYVNVANCTVLAGVTATGNTQAFNFGGTGGTVNVHNNVILDGRDRALTASGLTLVGSGNIGTLGGFSSTLFSTLGVGTDLTPTTNTSPGAGDWAIYDATTGALINAPDNDAVGVGTSTWAPATDILGKDRLRGAYADPGAFTTQLRTITKSIDAAGGGDYTTFTTAEADVATLPTAVDMVQRNEAIVFEAEAGTYNESVTLDSSSPGPALTTDATRNVTYRAAAGSEHGGDFTAGVRITSASISLTVREPFVRIEGLVVESTANYAFNASGEGVTLDACISKAPTACFLLGQTTVTAPLLATNCVAICDSSLGFWCVQPGDIEITNCTVLQTNGGTAYRVNDSGGQLSVALTNNVALSSSLGTYVAFGTPTITGSNNVGGATSPFPVAQQASSQTWTFTTDDQAVSTGDLVIYDATTGAMLNVPGNDAVGVGTSTGAPATDILGKDRLRGVYADPGAFTTDLVTIGRTIDAAGGGDYTTFTAAEAAVGSLVTDVDMVQRNEAVVFEATAGEYGLLHVGSTLVQDATRNVTYRAASGSEHNGVPGTGVILYSDSGSRTVTITDDFTAFEDLTAETRTGTSGRDCWYGTGVQGLTFRRCIARDLSSSANNTGFTILATGLTDPAATTIENCLTVDTLSAFEHEGGTNPVLRVRNCTVIGGTRGFYQLSATNPTIDAINVLLLGTTNVVQGSVTFTGSGNVGGSSSPFPVAQQASSQTWTFTTDDQAVSTGSQVIYDATNGALLNVPGNDAVGVGTSTGAPTTDILGEDRIRGAYADPGAFTTDLVTITKSIDAAGGGDYTTFTAAEADVATLPTDADMVQRNEAVVFEAEAGTYGGLIFSWTLTTDATRNVTFKPAAGSEHGGVFGAGVILQDNTAVSSYIALMDNASTNHCVFDGIAFNVRSGVTSACTAIRTGVGHIWRNCLFSSEGTGSLNRSEDSFSSGSAAAPIVFENCVTKGQSAYAFNSNKTGSSMRFVNCTHLSSDQMFGFYTYAASSQAVEIVNCVNLGGGASLTDSGPTVTAITGSDNVGGSSDPFPVGLQASSQTWTFSTNPADTSTGSLAIYDATSGALLNVPGNDAVGVCGVTGIPTTDINGEDRIRGTFADPGAFVAPLRTIAKTIDGAGGGDYTTFTTAEAAVSTLPTDADMVKRNEAIVFEAEAGTYNENVTCDSSTSGPALTTDATRNVTYRAAAGSEHGGVRGAGVKINSTGASSIRDDYLAWRGLELTSTTTGVVLKGDGVLLSDVLISGVHTVVCDVGSAFVENSVMHPSGYAFSAVASSGSPVSLTVTNCTALSNGATSVAIRPQQTSGTLSVDFTNVAVLGYAGAYYKSGTVTESGSNNVGGSSNPFPVALQASSQTWTFSTNPADASTGSQVIYDATSGALLNVPGNDAVGVGTSTGAPATDINGEERIRDTHADPGAFVAPLRTITKSIDAAGGGDYTTFTTAEAAVSTLPTDADMVKRNEALVFEAEAGTYNESVTFNSSSPGPALTTDATRNVTYTAAAGSEHGGSLSAGVNISGTTNISDSFTVLDGLVLRDPVAGTHTAASSSEGVTYRNCLAENPGSNLVFDVGGSGSALHPTVYENCVGYGTTGVASQRVWQLSTYSGDIFAKLVNCTTVAEGRWSFFVGGTTANTFNVEIVNHVHLGNSGVYAGNYTDPARVFTGSGNVGPALSPFPAAIQAEGQTWTFTTDTMATSTGNQVIYEAGTGRLSDAAGNDAWHILTDLSVAPATDIEGVTRSASGFNPGAFETTFISSISGQGAEVLGAPSASGTGNTSIAAQGVLVGPSPTLLSFANLIITAQANLSLGAADLTALGPRVIGGTGQLVMGSPSIAIFEGDLVLATGSLLASATQLSGRNTPSPGRIGFLTAASGRVSVSSTGVLKAAPGSSRGSLPGPKIFAQGNMADIPKHSKGSGFLNRQ